MKAGSFYKKQNKRPKIIMPLYAKFKTNRPEYPAWKYYILYPSDSVVRRSVCSGAEDGGSEFHVRL